MKESKGRYGVLKPNSDLLKESKRGYGLLKPICNLETVVDGRGGIFTWVPKKDIKEFSLIYYNPGTFRGEHYHPEFTEYLLIVEGEAAVVFKKPRGPGKIFHVSKGDCVYAEPGVAHTVHPITPLTAIAMLSKQWDNCEKPIIHQNVTEKLRKK